jgi:signal transduction histidine kinase
MPVIAEPSIRTHDASPATALPSTPVAGAWQVLVAHDLKNALGTLESQLERLTAAPTPGEARQAHRTCRDLRQRLVGLLTVQRGEAEGGLPAWPTDESPQELLQAMADAASTAADPIAIDVVIAPGAPSFWTYDPRLVRLALDAALHNALRFARHRIVLRASRQSGGLCLEVLDDGPGPGGAATDRDGAHATGLGTALCRLVAQAHSTGGRAGSVTLSAAGIGPNTDQPGARFSLWLP